MGKKRSKKRNSEEIGMITRVSQLDDPYKIFCGALLNAIGFFAMITIGVGINPLAIYEYLLDEIIEMQENSTLSFIWSGVGIILSVWGIIQVLVSWYIVWKFGKIGIIIFVTGFIGVLLVIAPEVNGWHPWDFYIGMILAVISIGCAIYSSEIKENGVKRG